MKEYLDKLKEDLIKICNQYNLPCTVIKEEN